MTQFLFLAAQDMAKADIPDSARCFMVSTMSVLRKRDGGVRGIATGTSFRRFIAKTLARQFGMVVESTCAPFHQFALSTRVGTDCVGHVVSDDGRGPRRHDPLNRWCRGVRPRLAQRNDEQIARRARVKSVAAFRQVHICQHNKYTWEDAAGVRHQIHQAEGGEQGDPLMPLLFSLAIHVALVAVQAELREGGFCSHIWTACTQ